MQNQLIQTRQTILRKGPRLHDAPPKKVIEPYQRPNWFDDDLSNAYEDRCRSVVKEFVTGQFNGRPVISKTNYRHVYTTRNEGSELWIYKDNRSIKVRICIAKKVNGFFLGNASSLIALKQPKTGKISMVSGGVLKIQEVLNEVMPMVPFQMFKEARLDLNQFELIEKNKGEMINLGIHSHQQRHFTGAMVFKIGVQKRSRELKGETVNYFLFDADRNEVALKNFNAFLSKLSRPCTSVADAYESLKPKEVYEAERFMTQPCERQGEWFFIPVQGDFEHKKEAPWGRGRPARQGAILRAKGNRAHYVDCLSVEGYVKGRVTHGGREHIPIELKQWCKAVPNTAIESYKISGCID